MFKLSDQLSVLNIAVVLLTAGGLLSTAGCSQSDRIEVGGRITRKDGSPLVRARVTFRSPKTGQTATGFTDEDGRYVLGTSQPGEGILPGGYYVTVSEDRGPIEGRRPPTVNEKYARANESGLLFKVEPGGETTFDMVLDPP